MIIHAKEIEEFITKARWIKVLEKDEINREKMCCSKGILEDSSLAIESYLEKDFPKDPGLLYLSIYGILQSLVLQQDSIKHLSQAFFKALIDIFSFDSLKEDLSLFKKNEIIDKIRKIRNSAMAHPMDSYGKPENYFYITRSELSKENITLLTFPEFTSKTVKICSLIEAQQKIVKEYYDKLCGELKEIDKNHLNKYENEKLEEIFRSSDYYLKEFLKAVEGETNTSFKEDPSIGIKSLRESLEEFKNKLIERREDTEELCEKIHIIGHAISKLELYLTGDLETKEVMKKEDARIYDEYLCEAFSMLKDYSKEIDKKYNA